MPAALGKNWLWCNLPRPQRRIAGLDELIDEEPDGVPWHGPAETARLLDMISDLNREKVRRVSQLRRRVVGTIYRRTRADGTGRRTQRAEVRFTRVRFSTCRLRWRLNITVPLQLTLSEVATAPSEAGIERRRENLSGGLAAMIVTTRAQVAVAEAMTEARSLADPLDILEFEPFLALYEWGAFD